MRACGTNRRLPERLTDPTQGDIAGTTANLTHQVSHFPKPARVAQESSPYHCVAGARRHHALLRRHRGATSKQQQWRGSVLGRSCCGGRDIS